MALETNIEENYRLMVKRGDRSYEQIAEQATKDGATNVAAWARAEADKAGANITPTGATPAPAPYAKRTIKDLDELVSERGITGTFATKQDRIDALEAADAAAASAAENVSAAASEGEYAELSDEEVVELAEAAEIPTEGERADIIARLLEHDAAETANGSGADVA